MLRVGIACLTALVLAACPSPKGALHVVVDAGAISEGEFDLLTVTVVRPGSGEVLAKEELIGDELSTPVRVTFVSGETTPPGTRLRVEVVAALGGATVASRVTEEEIPRGTYRTVDVQLVKDLVETTPEKGALGAACASASECDTGQCADGVCCDQACTGSCASCALPGSVGRCAPLAAGGPGETACGPYACDGVGLACPTSCTSGAACAATHQCASQACVPKLAAGAACVLAGQCLSGSCADGVCCDSACAGPCDVCDAAGSVGTCRPAGAGTAGAPSCAPYECGAAAACTTSCGVAADCAPGSYCGGGQCFTLKTTGSACGAAGECASGFCADGFCCGVACGGTCDRCDATPGSCTAVSSGGAGSCGGSLTCTASGACISPARSLSDDFADDSMNTSRWTLFEEAGTRAYERNGRLEVDTAVNAAGFAGFRSVSTFNAYGSSLSAQLAVPADPAKATLTARLALLSTSGAAVLLDVYGGDVHMWRRSSGGSVTEYDVDLYDPGTMKYLRIRGASGRTYWEYSTDGASWTRMYDRSNPVDLTEVRAEVSAGTRGQEAPSSLVSWDNVNLP